MPPPKVLVAIYNNPNSFLAKLRWSGNADEEQEFSDYVLRYISKKGKKEEAVAKKLVLKLGSDCQSRVVKEITIDALKKAPEG